MLVSLTWLLEHVERETLAFSFPAEHPALERSIREHGVTTPLTIAKVGGRAILLNGHRRLAILQKLASHQPLEILMKDVPSGDLSHVFAAKVSESAARATLNTIERARILKIAQTVLDTGAEEIVRRWLPLVGLQPSPKILQEHLNILSLTPEWQEWIVDKEIPLKPLAALTELPSDDQEALWSLVARLSLGKNLFEEVLSEMTLLGRRENRSLTELAAELSAAAGDFRKTLHERAYPQITKMQQTFEQKSRALNLPSSITLKPPAFFEGDRYQIHFQFGSPDELRLVGKRLQHAADQSDLEEILHLL